MGTKLLLRKSGGEIMSLGDSVTVGADDPYGGYVFYLNGLMNTEAGGTWTYTNLGEGSNTIVNEATEVDSRIVGSTTPRFITIFFGQNDQYGDYTESQWKTPYRYILDAVHTMHPTAKIYLGLGGLPDRVLIYSFWGWMESLVAERPTYCHMGINQITLFADNVPLYMGESSSHPTTAGHLLLARSWADILIAAL